MHSLSMSNHESKPLDPCSLFPAACVCFLHTLTKTCQGVTFRNPTNWALCTQTVFPVVRDCDEWGLFCLGGGLLSLWRDYSLIYYTPKYKTTQPAAALISSPGFCRRRPRRLPPLSASQGDSVALLRIMLWRQLICWHLLALLFLPFCLCQDEYMEVSRRANRVVARIVESHQQTGRSGSRREKVRERSQPKTGTVDNNTSTDLKPLRPDELPHPEVDDLAQINPYWGQVFSILF